MSEHVATSVQGPPDQSGGGSEIYQLVLHDIIERSEFGARKYGMPLRTEADIDWMVNAYQELLDMLVYMRGRIEQLKRRPEGAERPLGELWEPIKALETALKRGYGMEDAIEEVIKRYKELYNA